MKATALRILILVALYLPAVLNAADLPVVRVGMLQFGTAHWELSHIQTAGLDRRNGYRLELRPLANSSAGRLALTSGSVDWIVADWVWAAQRTLAGEPMRFVPFSARIGEVVVASDSSINAVSDLVGKRIGVAGGPQGKSWQLLSAAAQLKGIDLAEKAEVSFGAPPLLGRELEAGRIDALLTFWHFADRLTSTRHYRPAFTAASMVTALGVDPRLPTLGYLAHEEWVVENPELAEGFVRSVAQAKEALRDDSPWVAIKPLMRAKSDAEYAALKEGFRRGEPASHLDDDLISSARTAWPLISHSEKPLPVSIFRGVAP
jgi:NitT/TauT family transport system substrate-binding protein